ncbi:MAG: DUF167 domain-containing protein [Actinomycetota bacterium]|nr:DUF167 domain-containing protein [Actinomycetota bacterium]
MSTITVRVTPRSGRSVVEVGADGIVVRVRSAPAAGRATEEGARTLASALRVPRSTVRLRTGARSRTKSFEITGLSSEEVERRLRAL